MTTSLDCCTLFLYTVLVHIRRLDISIIDIPCIHTIPRLLGVVFTFVGAGVWVECAVLSLRVEIESTRSGFCSLPFARYNSLSTSEDEAGRLGGAF